MSTMQFSVGHGENRDPASASPRSPPALASSTVPAHILPCAIEDSHITPIASAQESKTSQQPLGRHPLPDLSLSLRIRDRSRGPGTVTGTKNPGQLLHLRIVVRPLVCPSHPQHCAAPSITYTHVNKKTPTFSLRSGGRYAAQQQGPRSGPA